MARRDYRRMVKALLLAMGLAMLAPSGAGAQALQHDMPCYPKKVAETTAERQFATVPAGRGLVSDQTAIALWIAPDGTFIILAYPRQLPGMACIVALGSDWQALRLPPAVEPGEGS